MDIAELLAFAVKNNASDLHLSSGLPPMIRVDGDIRRLTLPALDTAQLQELLSGTTVEELTQAEAAVKQAAARRDQLAVDVSRHEIRAPVDGIVDTRVFELGERPAPGQVLMIVLPGSQAHTAVFLSSPWPTIVRYGMRPCG